MIDILLIAIVAVVAWCVSGEGAYAALVSLVSVILAGLLAMNFFEPLANLLQANSPASWASRWDMIALIGLFVAFVALFRLVGDQLMPTYIQVHPLLHQIGSWGGGVLTGYVTMAFLLTALHTAPFPRDYWGYFYPERELRSGPLSAFGPDYQWLGFTQYVTEKPFGKDERIGDATSGTTIVMKRMFDGRTGWFWNMTGEQSQNLVMPSFTLRYASRRERLSGTAAPSTGGGGEAPAVKKRPRPSGGDRRPSF